MLLFSLLLLFFLPGWMALLAAPPIRRALSPLERVVASAGISIVLLDISLLLFGAFGISLSRLPLYLLVAVFFAVAAALHFFGGAPFFPRPDNGTKHLFAFSRKQSALLLLLIALTIGIKTVYLADTAFPTATDMGHHLYWVQKIIETGQLPAYEESDIIQSGEGYALSASFPIADFIIGEHLPLAAVSILSGASVFSASPVIVLFLIQLLGILALFLFSLRAFGTFLSTHRARSAALLVLLFSGPLYAIASPQAKYISGGVVGNIFGDFLLPLIAYLLLRALSFSNQQEVFQKQKRSRSWFLFLALFLIFGLFYTHHLSAFILLFSLAFGVVFFAIFHRKDLPSFLRRFFFLLAAPHNIILSISIVLFFFFVYAPSYLEVGAVETAVGEVSKSTRAGLSFSQVTETVGSARMAFGLLGAGILLFLSRGKMHKTAAATLLGFSAAPLLLTISPEWFFINLPSNRISHYVGIFFAPLAGLGCFVFFDRIRQMLHIFSSLRFVRAALFFLFFVSITYILFNGLADNASFANRGTDAASAQQTFSAAAYTAGVINEDDQILKDHNYLTADAWMKIFFARGYNFPLSRSNFGRYEDPTKPREICTLQMISAPQSPVAAQCFLDLNVRFIIVNRETDSAQFANSADFSLIYVSDAVAVFERK